MALLPRNRSEIDATDIKIKSDVEQTLIKRNLQQKKGNLFKLIRLF